MSPVSQRGWLRGGGIRVARGDCSRPISALDSWVLLPNCTKTNNTKQAGVWTSLECRAQAKKSIITYCCTHNLTLLLTATIFQKSQLAWANPYRTSPCIFLSFWPDPTSLASEKSLRYMPSSSLLIARELQFFANELGDVLSRNTDAAVRKS